MASPRKHIKALEKRLAFVSDRIASWEPSSTGRGEAGLAFYRAERNALLWSLPILRERAGLPPYGDAREQTLRAELEAEAIAKAIIGQQRQAEAQRLGAIAPPADDTRPRSFA